MCIAFAGAGARVPEIEDRPAAVTSGEMLAAIHTGANRARRGHHHG
jgi:hypothetical protein